MQIQHGGGDGSGMAQQVEVVEDPFGHDGGAERGAFGQVHDLKDRGGEGVGGRKN